MRFTVLAIYTDSDPDLLMRANTLSETVGFAFREADRLGLEDAPDRPRWIRITDEGKMLIEISIISGGLLPDTLDTSLCASRSATPSCDDTKLHRTE